MNHDYSPVTVLTDHTRLPEIYRLRVLAWENSPGRDNINSTKYPDGFSDHLEERSIHFISTNPKGEIIGAARLTVCQSLDELPYAGIFKAYEHKLPNERPFLFYSRLVLHPDYRKTGLVKEFDESRVRFQDQHSYCFTVASAKIKRRIVLEPFGFRFLGNITLDADPSYPFSSEHMLLYRTL